MLLCGSFIGLFQSFTWCLCLHGNRKKQTAPAVQKNVAQFCEFSPTANLSFHINNLMLRLHGLKLRLPSFLTLLDLRVAKDSFEAVAKRLECDEGKARWP